MGGETVKRGYARVVNIKGDADYGPEPGEVVMTFDRTSKLFGNPHFMRSQSASERARVIALFKADLDADVEARGPRCLAMEEMARMIVENGARYCLRCHCKPLDCHVDVIANRIGAMVLELEGAKEKVAPPVKMR